MYLHKLRSWSNCYLICNAEIVNNNINSYKLIDLWGNNEKIDIEIWVDKDIVLKYNFNLDLPQLTIISPYNINSKERLIYEDIIEVIFTINNIKKKKLLYLLDHDKFLFVLNLLQFCLYK